MQTLQWKDPSANNSRHGGSFTIQLQKGSKRIKHIPGVLHPPLQWCGRKVGWTDSQNICRLWRTFLLKSDEKKPWSNTKAWAGKLWSNFCYLNRSRRSGYRALNKHIFKWVASKNFPHLCSLVMSPSTVGIRPQIWMWTRAWSIFLGHVLCITSFWTFCLVLMSTAQLLISLQQRNYANFQCLKLEMKQSKAQPYWVMGMSGNYLKFLLLRSYLMPKNLHNSSFRRGSQTVLQIANYSNIKMFSR